MSDRPTYIYALCEPGTEVAAGEIPPPDRVRYVGKAVNPVRRYREHCRCDTDQYVARWTQALRADGEVPAFVILEVTTADLWPSREMHWIGFFKAAGARLTNLTSGGEGVAYTDETMRLRHDAAVRLALRSPETRELIGRITRERFAKNPGQRAAYSARMRMHMATAEGRAQLARAVEASRSPEAAEKRQRRVQAALDRRPIETQRAINERIAQSHRARIAADPSERERIACRTAATWKGDEGRKRSQGERMRALWQDPEWKARQVTAVRAAKGLPT